MRCLLFVATLLAAGSVYAQFYAANATGYTRTERGLGTAAPGSFMSHGGAAWDPTGPDVYFWDVATGVIRRFDTLAGVPAMNPLFTVPPGPFGFTFVDTIAFDESSNDLYIGESGGQVMHKVRRTGVDAIDPTFGVAGIQTSAAYTFFLYDIKFDPFGRLLGSAANTFGAPPESGVYSFSKTTLAATQIINLRTPGGTDISGPIAFDAQGNLFYALPPSNPDDPMRIARWSKTSLDAAINSAGATVLTIDDATLVIDWTDNFPNAGSMGFRFEGGNAVLFFAANDGTVYRSDLDTHAYSIFATAAVPPVGEVPFPSALAIENPSASFRPFSGDSARLCVVMGARDAAFDQVRHSLCLFGCSAAPTGVVDLDISGLPAVVTNGLAFGATVELRDGADALLDTTNGTVQAEIISGAGTLSGRTTAVAVNGVAIFDELVVSGGSISVMLRFTLVGGTAARNTAALPVGATGGVVIEEDDDKASNCSASHGSSGMTLLAVAILAAVCGLKRRRAC